MTKKLIIKNKINLIEKLQNKFKKIFFVRLSYPGTKNYESGDNGAEDDC